MELKRVTLIVGHYGSGKTNIAVNLALEAKKTKERVALADLDIVNPYFRSKDSADDLAKAGIAFICSPYANTNVDLPALPQEMYAVTDDRSQTAILDIGGDDRGALALGRLTPAILKENDFDMWAVINAYRPLTEKTEDAIDVLNEVSASAGLPITGLINNSNIGRETTAGDVLNSLQYAEEISRLTGIPVVMTTVEQSLYDDLKNKIPNVFPLTLQKKIV